MKGETGYSLNGKQAIRLKLKSKTVVVSTNKADEIIHIIEELNESN